MNPYNLPTHLATLQRLLYFEYKMTSCGKSVLENCLLVASGSVGSFSYSVIPCSPRATLLNMELQEVLQIESVILTSRVQSFFVSGSYFASAILKYEVHGSVVGPSLFSDYSSPVVSMGSSPSISVHCYADNTKLYVAFHQSEEVVVLKKL